VWWFWGNRMGFGLPSLPGVRVAFPRDDRAVGTTSNAVNGSSAASTTNGHAIGPRVVVHHYRLGRIRELREGESRLEFRDRPAAAGFLRWLAAEPGMLATLRSIHAAVGASGATHRLDDRAVLEQVALWLGTPSLEVAVGYHLLPVVTTSTYEPLATPEDSRPREDRPAPVAFPTYTRRREPAPPEQDPLVLAMLIRQQVETLRRAARDGIPFCEECEKARLRRRPAALAGASR
jgi:hypothetical protein